ncbi:MAG TPA: FAD:protein FMN transferase [Acidobacteriaceae bacterium]|nr:FAD:protein FMN transferase [Acidobacteriaceae bacterium]
MIDATLNPVTQLYCTTHPAMGTEYSLYLYAPSREQAAAIAKPVFEEVDRVDALLSNYRSDSELSRINREAFDHAVTTDPETFRFLATCLAWSERSQGAFDIAVGKLMKVWKFFGASGALPTPEEIAAAREHVGWEKIRLDPEQRTVRFLSAEIELDPGGIGKGYAVDRAVKTLRAKHVPAALLSAGSSTIYALGAPPGEAGWKVRVPSPHPEGGTISTVILRDTSLSTANLSEKNFVHEGQFYGAIMNPRTLQPVRGMLQVTVISRSATDSDALSNALFVSGPEDRTSLLAEQDCALVIREQLSEVEQQVAPPYEAIRWPSEVAQRHLAELPTTKEKEKL